MQGNNPTTIRRPLFQRMNVKHHIAVWLVLAALFWGGSGLGACWYINADVGIYEDPEGLPLVTRVLGKVGAVLAAPYFLSVGGLGIIMESIGIPFNKWTAPLVFYGVPVVYSAVGYFPFVIWCRRRAGKKTVAEFTTNS